MYRRYSFIHLPLPIRPKFKFLCNSLVVILHRLKATNKGLTPLLPRIL